MSDNNRAMIEQFMRLEGLLHRYFAGLRKEQGPHGNPHRGQGRVLSILKMQPEMSQKELSYLLDMRQQSLGELLSKLEKNGFITRTPSESDKRAMMVKLTEAGAQATVEREESGWERPFDCLNEEEQKQFSAYVEKISNAVEELLGEEGTRGMPPFFGRGGFGEGFAGHSHGEAPPNGPHGRGPGGMCGHAHHGVHGGPDDMHGCGHGRHHGADGAHDGCGHAHCEKKKTGDLEEESGTV